LVVPSECFFASFYSVSDPSSFRVELFYVRGGEVAAPTIEESPKPIKRKARNPKKVRFISALIFARSKTPIIKVRMVLPVAKEKAPEISSLTNTHFLPELSQLCRLINDIVAGEAVKHNIYSCEIHQSSL